MLFPEKAELSFVHPPDEGVVVMFAHRQFEIAVAGALDERVSIQSILEGDVELQLVSSWHR